MDLWIDGASLMLKRDPLISSAVDFNIRASISLELGGQSLGLMGQTLEFRG